MSYMNRLGNCHNKYQMYNKRVLCVCSAGLLRSPTAAVVLSQDPYNFNTRAAGISEEYALIQVDDVLLNWADEIVCMEEYQKHRLIYLLNGLNLLTPVICLDIKDNYSYRDPVLISHIKNQYDKYYLAHEVE